MQSVRFIQPHPAIKPFVRDYAFFSHAIDGWSKDYVYPLPAMREHTLQLFLDDIPTLHTAREKKHFTVARCNIFGLVDHSFLDSHMPPFCTRLQITFTATGFYRMTGIPAHTFVNVLTDASLVWNHTVPLLVEQLMEEQDIALRGQILDRFLRQLMDRRHNQRAFADIDHIAQGMLHYAGEPDMKKLAQACYKSTRQFERLFKECVGISAKKFSRINRFVHANKLKLLYPEQSWFSIALDCDYYDLNHLAKDFKTLGRFPMSDFNGYDYAEDKVIPRQR